MEPIDPLSRFDIVTKVKCGNGFFALDSSNSVVQMSDEFTIEHIYRNPEQTKALRAWIVHKDKDSAVRWISLNNLSKRLKLSEKHIICYLIEKGLMTSKGASANSISMGICNDEGLFNLEKCQELLREA